MNKFTIIKKYNLSEEKTIEEYISLNLFELPRVKIIENYVFIYLVDDSYMIKCENVELAKLMADQIIEEVLRYFVNKEIFVYEPQKKNNKSPLLKLFFLGSNAKLVSDFLNEHTKLETIKS